MTQKFDVIIVGGGVIGLTAALAMAQREFSVAVIDAGPMSANSTSLDPRVYAINQASKNLFQQVNLWQSIDEARLSAYHQMYVWDAANNAHIQFDARMVAAQNLGHIVEESVLKASLLQQIEKQERISIFPNSKVSAVEPAVTGARISDGKQHWQTKLLMIADGANSPCRQLLNVPLTTWSYHQQAIIALVKVEKPHQQTAYQVFNSDGPLAFLPLVNQNLCSIVWSTTPTRAQQLMSTSEDAFNEALRNAFNSKLGQVTLQGQRQQFPLMMRHAKQYIGTSWLLLGDAAHTIHPLAGLGLNVGLADISVWLTCLDATKKNLTSKKALGAYQRQRKYAVWKIITMMEGLKMVFSNPLLTTFRGIGLHACNNFSPLKRLLIEEAAGCELIEF